MSDIKIEIREVERKGLGEYINEYLYGTWYVCRRLTVDREIFAVKIIHVLNFRAFNFRCLTVL